MENLVAHPSDWNGWRSPVAMCVAFIVFYAALPPLLLSLAIDYMPPTANDADWRGLLFGGGILVFFHWIIGVVVSAVFPILLLWIRGDQFVRPGADCVLPGIVATGAACLSPLLFVWQFIVFEAVCAAAFGLTYWLLAGRPRPPYISS